MELLYSISSLRCSYNQGKHIVLEIDQLEIPSGKIVFVIGASGVGKSTVLEALGMMTYTLHEPSASALLFHDPSGKEKVDLVKLWGNNDQLISGFRKKHFSFIFQNTNLMSNLTAHENVHITQLIQGRSYMDARKKTKEILDAMGLSEVRENQPINTLSGGQRQRLAFCRAIAPDFTILFGDEPTGNLDVNNAHNLMDVLKKTILETGRSAIIVSHDIDLSIKYGDIIIFIRKDYRQANHKNGLIEYDSFGKISGDSLFIRNGNQAWSNKGTSFNDETLKMKLIKDLYHISNLDI
jgi:ABC-type lipoprotein export system ATPase subunit